MEKAAIVENLQKQGKAVCFVGDGIIIFSRVPKYRDWDRTCDPATQKGKENEYI